jgi:EF hand
MKRNTWMTFAVAAALAAPLAVYAAGDKATSTSGASSAGATSDGGAEAMFKALDKDNDGFLTRDEVKGTPHDAAFDTLDTNHDGKLSREEHAAAPEHAGKASSGSSAAPSTTSPSGSDSTAAPSSSPITPSAPASGGSKY